MKIYEHENSRKLARGKHRCGRGHGIVGVLAKMRRLSHDKGESNNACMTSARPWTHQHRDGARRQIGLSHATSRETRRTE